MQPFALTELVHTVHTVYITAYIKMQIASLVSILYNRFRAFSPDCTFHTAITHVITVGKLESHVNFDGIIMCGLRHSNTVIT